MYNGVDFECLAGTAQKLSLAFSVWISVWFEIGILPRQLIGCLAPNSAVQVTLSLTGEYSLTTDVCK